MSSGQEVGEIFGSGSGPATALLRSPTVIIASIGLWGMNIFFFRLFGIDYIKVLNGGKDPSPQTEPARSNGESGKESQVGGHDPNASKALVKDVSGAQELTQTAKGRLNKSDNKSDNKPVSNKKKSPEMACSGSEVTAGKCLSLCCILFILLHLTEYVFINVLKGGTIGAIFAFYVTATFGMALPLRQTRWIRVAIGTVVYRAMELVNPRCSCLGHVAPIPVPFVDVFFADAMCSMSKVFFDWGLLWLCASYYPYPVPATTHSIIIPSICAAFPYLIRARQCLVMYNIGKIKGDSKHYQHMLNAIKYSTSLFPICVSAYQKIDVGKKEQMESFLIVLLIVNSLYSYAWDILMDWGMMQNPTLVLTESCVPNSKMLADQKPTGCAHACLRPRLRFGCLPSAGILLADGILRFSWTLRFYEHAIFPSTDIYILCTELLEAFRRAIWNLLRVEWENIKQTNATASKHYNEKDEEQTPFLINTSSIELSSMATRETLE